MLSKEQQLLGKEQKRMMKQMNMMKIELSSKLSAIIELLIDLKGGRMGWGEDHLSPKEVEQEMAIDDELTQWRYIIDFV